MSCEIIQKLSDIRVKFACDLCQRLNQEKIAYSVMHGCEDFPNSIGRDIDILIDQKQLPEAVLILTERATNLSWNTILAPIPWAGAPLVFWKTIDGIPVSFEIHLMPHLEWCGVSLVSGSSASENYVRYHEPFPRSLTASFAKRVVIQILANCWEKLELKREEISIYNEEKEAVPRYVKAIFGTELGNEFLEAVAKVDIQSFKKMSPSLRRVLLLNALKQEGIVRLSPRWAIGKACKLTTYIPWRLPNIIISGDEDSTTTETASEIHDHLCFTKSEIIISPKPWKVFSWLRLLWKLRSKSAIFRFTILIDTHQKTGFPSWLQPSCRRRYPLFFVRLKKDPPHTGRCLVEIRCSSRNSQTTTRDSIMMSNLSAYIANHYLGFSTQIAKSI